MKGSHSLDLNFAFWRNSSMGLVKRRRTSFFLRKKLITLWRAEWHKKRIKSALGEGRFCWRHEEVLKVKAEAISSTIDQAKCHRPSQCNITFGRAGEHPNAKPKAQVGLLGTANDCQLRAWEGNYNSQRTSWKPFLAHQSRWSCWSWQCHGRIRCRRPVKEPKHPMTPGTITDDVPKHITRCII